MRLVVVDIGKDDVNDSGLSTETPVVFGDNGDAMIGAGIVCRLSVVGVTYPRSTALSVLLLGVFNTLSKRESFSGVREAVLSESSLLRISTGESILRASREDSALARSSHFPRTASRLAPTRCVGAHLRVATLPVGEFSIPLVTCELDRDRDPVPPRDEVRSRRRV